MKVLTVVLGLLLAVSLALLGKVWWTERKVSQANAALNEQLMKADLDLGRAHTQFGDAQKKITELEGRVAAEILERNAVIQSFGELELKYQTIVKKGKGKTETVYVDVPGEGPRLESFRTRYDDHRLHLDLIFVPPDQTTVDYELTLRFRGQLVQTLLPSGGINNYATFWEVDESGKDVQKLELTRFEVIVENPANGQWFWWAPHIDIGGLIGVGLPLPNLYTGASLGFSFFGWGQTVDDLEWRVLRLSADFVGGTLGLGITPGLYNLGKPIPLISNLWIGPHVSYLPIENEWFVGGLIGGVL